ncbi:MAG TPA: beta-eliminating lyase-related protein [Thermoanaerobaculia bacterium]
MTEWTRRSLIGAGTGALAARIRFPQAKAAPSAAQIEVNFVGDGLELSPSAYADLLAKLSRSGVQSDEYSRGGAVEALEKQFAAILGKEAAVFLPSGTLANHLAVRTLAGTRRRVLVQDASHLYNDSGDCAEQLSGLTLVPLASGKATFGWDEAARAIDRGADGRVPAPVGAISIESPVRRLHGETFDFGEMRRISEETRRRGIGLHLDGARLFVACAYSGRLASEYAELFDTVYVSLWKCFNSGGGAILAGPASRLADLYQVRRMFGGALWNAWPYAAVARHYAEGYLGRLTAAVKRSEELIGLFNGYPDRFTVSRVANGTSLFRLKPRTGDLAAFRQRLAAKGTLLPEPDGEGSFWLKVNESLAQTPVRPDALAAVFRSAL